MYTWCWEKYWCCCSFKFPPKQNTLTPLISYEDCKHVLVLSGNVIFGKSCDDGSRNEKLGRVIILMF